LKSNPFDFAQDMALPRASFSTARFLKGIPGVKRRFRPKLHEVNYKEEQDSVQRIAFRDCRFPIANCRFFLTGIDTGSSMLDARYSTADSVRPSADSYPKAKSKYQIAKIHPTSPLATPDKYQK
jgi:hypothetical protein